MDLNELLRKQKELQEKIQNDFIDKTKDNVDFLQEKVNRDDYVLTQHEKDTIRAIYVIIQDITKTFIGGER
jgi:hypothetical protein